MARITMDQAQKLSSEGGSFFKLADGESCSVRILWDSIDDIPVYTVHRYANSNTQTYALINCANVDGEDRGVCPWCASLGKPVCMVFIPIFNTESNKVQYWARSATYVRKTILPFLNTLMENYPGQPVSGCVIKIKRTGKNAKDTTYSYIPVTTNDGKTAESFGELPDLYDCGQLKQPDWKDDNAQETQTNNVTEPGMFNTGTRHTTSTFI